MMGIVVQFGANGVERFFCLCVFYLCRYVGMYVCLVLFCLFVCLFVFSCFCWFMCLFLYLFVFPLR